MSTQDKKPRSKTTSTGTKNASAKPAASKTTGKPAASLKKGTGARKAAAPAKAAPGKTASAKPAAARKPAASKKTAAQKPDLVQVIINALEDLKAQNIVTLDVRTLTDVMDALVIATGNSNRQVKALADHVMEEARKQGWKAMSAEGLADGEWALIDFTDVVVHVMQPAVRELYDLEGLWEMPATAVKTVETAKAATTRAAAAKSATAKPAASKTTASKAAASKTATTQSGTAKKAAATKTAAAKRSPASKSAPRSKT